MENKLIENVDYYLDEIGRMVFTEAYHLKRGYCCKNECFQKLASSEILCRFMQIQHI